MMGIRCDYSDASDCSECNEPVCLRHMRRKNDQDDAPRFTDMSDDD